MHITNKEWVARLELTAAYHLAAQHNWTDCIYTHISARVPDETDTYLINPFGLNFSEVTPENLVKVNFAGKIVSSSHNFGINPSSMVIHSAIHGNREDVNCILHFHTVNGIAISSVKSGLLPMSQHALHLYGDIAYHDYEGVALLEDEKKTIIEDLGDKSVLLLRNHGFLTAGNSVAEAFMLMYMLEKAAEIQIKTLSQGLDLCVIPQEICERAKKQVEEHRPRMLKLEWQAMLRQLKNPIFAPIMENILVNSNQTPPKQTNAEPYYDMKKANY